MDRMHITPLSHELTGSVRDLMTAGAPWVRPRDPSDYWLCAELFAPTCPLALAGDGTVIGALIAYRSQVQPAQLYVQDLIVDPDRRRQGVAAALLAHLRRAAGALGCEQIYLTSEPANAVAHQTWLRSGFVNRPGDYRDAATGVHVVRDFKGPGKDRAVYDLELTPDTRPRNSRSTQGDLGLRESGAL